MINIELRKSSTKNKQVPKIVFEGFGLDQVWSQIVHHTDRTNQQVIQKLSNLIENEGFIKELAEEIGNDSTNEDEDEESQSQDDKEKEDGFDADYGNEEDGDKKDDEDDYDKEIDDDLNEDEDEDEALENYLDD